MNVRKATKAQTSEFWHEIGVNMRDASLQTFLVCTQKNEIQLFQVFPPVDAYLLGVKYPKTQMSASRLLTKEAREILSKYFLLHFW